jgi:hypothetical protein
MLARTDFDTVETGEWLDSLRAVLHYQGAERAAFLLEKLTDEAQQAGVSTPLTLNTPYVNTISPEHEERANWDRAIEHRVPRAMGTSSPEFFLAPGATTLGLIKMRKHKRIVAYGVRPRIGTRTRRRWTWPSQTNRNRPASCRRPAARRPRAPNRAGCASARALRQHRRRLRSNHPHGPSFICLAATRVCAARQGTRPRQSS